MTNILPKNVRYYGRTDPLPERTQLRAGPLSLVYVEGDLRYVKLGDQEILRRVYVAVRDRNWGTVLPALSNVHLDVADDSFRISYDVENKAGDIDFFWQGTITGNAQGTIAFSMEGVARSTFLRNRIGFCVLHPMRECAGRPCVVEKVDGNDERGTFPKHISPHQPFMDMRAISHEVVPGVWAEVRFAGDVFEMEDQRNWTDASYKTYCTPLALPFPVKVKEGTQISQSVTLTLKGEPSSVPASSPRAGLSFVISQAATGLLPRIGLRVAGHGQALSKTEVTRLKALNLSHLRADLVLSDPEHESALYQAMTVSKALGVPLEIAVHLSGAAEDELRSFVDVLEKVKPAVCTWLVFHKSEKSTTEKWVRLARKHLSEYDPQALIGSGTDAFFTELNRERPPVAVLDLVSYSLTPQVHAFDNASLVENLETQAVTVESARQFCDELRIAISPITFKMRFNPNATSPDGESPPGELPRQVDMRQMSLFGAGWTTGSLKYLAESGVYSATYYETVGWLGVMERDSGSDLPGKFCSLPGAVFPLYHALADISEFAGGVVIPAASSDTLRVDGMAMHKEGRTRVLLANLSPEPQTVTVENLGEHVRVRRLDEMNVEDAMRSPEIYRGDRGKFLHTVHGTLELDFLPYALVRVDSVPKSDVNTE